MKTPDAKPSVIPAPAALRAHQAWLVWKFEQISSGKPRKVPYYINGRPRNFTHGSPQDVRSLGTYDQALSLYQRHKYDGIGFATLPQWGITALDFDNCVANGEVHPDVEALLGDTYAEYSPSGNGVRAFITGSFDSNKKDPHNPDFGLELFSTKGFVTLTGRTLPLTELLGNTDTVAAPAPELAALIAQRFPTSQTPSAPAAPGANDTSAIECALALLPDSLAYDDWLIVGMAIHHETHGEGFHLWHEWSAKSPKHSNTDYVLDRWKSFGRSTGNPVTLASLFKLAGISPTPPATPDEFEDLSSTPLPEPKASRFTVLSAQDFASTPPPRWLIKHILPEAELVVLYGAPGSGKSFIALDAAMAIARGVPWRGRKTKPGRVVYLAAEGAGGFRNRMAAYAQVNHLDLSTVPFGIISAAPNMLDGPQAKDVVRAIVASGGASVVVVDTFAQVMPGGDENGGKDVGLALAHCKRIHAATGAVVILIHHSGKDATKGARGWSGLKGAADAELEVLRTPGGRMLRISKQKDGEDSLQWGFGLEVVNIGMDEDGEVITSCVVVDAPLGVPAGVPDRALGPVEIVVNDVIQEFLGGSVDGIDMREILVEAAKRVGETPQKGVRDTRYQRVKRVLEKLCSTPDSGYVIENGVVLVA